MAIVTPPITPMPTQRNSVLYIHFIGIYHGVETRAAEVSETLIG